MMNHEHRSCKTSSEPFSIFGYKILATGRRMISAGAERKVVDQNIPCWHVVDSSMSKGGWPKQARCQFSIPPFSIKPAPLFCLAQDICNLFQLSRSLLERRAHSDAYDERIDWESVVTQSGLRRFWLTKVSTCKYIQKIPPKKYMGTWICSIRW